MNPTPRGSPNLRQLRGSAWTHPPRSRDGAGDRAARRMEGGSRAEVDHLLIAQVMLRAALERRESRGATLPPRSPGIGAGRPERSFFKPAPCNPEFLQRKQPGRVIPASPLEALVRIVETPSQRTSESKATSRRGLSAGRHDDVGLDPQPRSGAIAGVDVAQVVPRAFPGMRLRRSSRWMAARSPPETRSLNSPDGQHAAHG